MNSKYKKLLIEVKINIKCRHQYLLKHREYVKLLQAILYLLIELYDTATIQVL